jgi:predicted ArsR family transcriptional regulator
MVLARDRLGARSILVHFNNLENLSESDAARAAALARRYAEKPFTSSAIRGDILKTRNKQTLRRFLDDLLKYGYIRAHHEKLQRGGRPAVQYVLAGAAKLAGAILEENAAR